MWLFYLPRQKKLGKYSKQSGPSEILSNIFFIDILKKIFDKKNEKLIFFSFLNFLIKIFKRTRKKLKNNNNFSKNI